MAGDGRSKPKVLSPKQAGHEKQWNHLSTLVASDAKRHGKSRMQASTAGAVLWHKHCTVLCDLQNISSLVTSHPIAPYEPIQRIPISVLDFIWRV